MKFQQKVIMVICICLLASCSPAPSLSPCAYNQLLTNVKDFFCVTIELLGQGGNFAIGQAIARLYYGHYHLSRLIYNNIKGCDGDNHTLVWKQMPIDIRSYGEALKNLRVKYDYSATSFSQSEVSHDLEYIENHIGSFNKIINELYNSVGKFNDDPMFIREFNEKIIEVKTTYQEVIQRITDVLNNMRRQGESTN